MTNISLHIPNEKHPTTVCACMCVWFHGIWGTDGVIVKETELICLTKKAKHRFWSSLDLKIQSPNKVQNKSNFHTSSCSHMGLENNQYTNFNHYCMSAESNNQSYSYSERKLRKAAKLHSYECEMIVTAAPCNQWLTENTWFWPIWQKKTIFRMWLNKTLL